MAGEEVILITGASRGIGAAAALELAGPGRAVLVNYLKSEEAARAVRRAVLAKGGACELLQADVTSAAEVDRMFETVRKSFGGLDALVLNAGVPYRYARFAENALEEYRRQWLSQAGAAYLCCSRAAALMAGRKGGRIVFVLSSVVAGEPPAFMAPYVSAKYAALGFAKALAAELSPKGIRVDTVAPGMTDTDFIKGFPRPIVEAAAESHPHKRLYAPEETARLVSELLGAKTG